MSQLSLYNTLTRKKEEFKPINKNEVGLYTCGPTVYNYAHIGNLRTYLFEDFLKRVLEYNDFQVKHIMNITDVGHLTGDMDMGEDKLELGAKREGKTAREIALHYEKAFIKDLELLNIESPSIYARVTDNISEQIDLIKILEDRGYTYKTSDGLYFNTSKVSNYNKLSHLPLEELREGARVEINTEKRNATDFALWKFSPVGVKRQMEWESPWGIGFPGWHIECSAISLKYLSGELDIHCGGADHINIHHTNEIAQSESATGKKFFDYWLHGAFLNIKGGKKMAKSDGDFLTLENALVSKNINPLAYRFAALQVNYRKPMEYSDEGIKQASDGLNSLLNSVASLGKEISSVNKEFKDKFLSAINNDLNLPQALALISAVLKSKLSSADKLATILDFDRVFGLKLDLAKDLKNQEINFCDLDEDIKLLIKNRQLAREQRNWEESDNLRDELRDRGYLIEDIKDAYKVSRL